ncbi:serine hydroxymethyltransferase [Candidatus Mycoplasma haematobovis]|uniref:Serine hydroxymethyltransferase n=1 Tax=Candidatus Mycoplasma haematobovis TaxID=432608 RepID=A0A1A9QDL7_9MOLU|nr:serine hydroxymethyltransferase [Candidatus Mycoplasma haematobovis]OAL10184.1 serine hydroxymethyltransferase [Candidatus Mycoplasma haematobovis]
MSSGFLLRYIRKEQKRQKSTLSLIASENLIYPEALKLASKSLINKYVEGYANKRFYAGCQNIDEVENYAIELAKKLFNCSFANVQPYSGSTANFAIYKALLKPRDIILSLEMSGGGHLTHSSKLSFVSEFYEVHTYSLDEKNLIIDYENLRNKALKLRPKLIIAGASSYPFSLDFERFRKIADEVGAYLLADICHYSAFVITGLHQHCFPHAHVAMFTTHKQLRGGKGAVILWNDPSFPINKAVFPGIQGGLNVMSLIMNTVALEKATTPEFKEYAHKILEIASYLVKKFKQLGVEVIGTETHMLLINTKKSFGLTGKEATNILEQAGLITNQNLLPFDTEAPSVASGIRIGSLTLAALNFTKEELDWLATRIYRLLANNNKEEVKKTKTELLKILSGK